MRATNLTRPILGWDEGVRPCSRPASVRCWPGAPTGLGPEIKVSTVPHGYNCCSGSGPVVTRQKCLVPPHTVLAERLGRKRMSPRPPWEWGVAMGRGRGIAAPLYCTMRPLAAENAGVLVRWSDALGY
jgi:hypothetical protein